MLFLLRRQSNKREGKNQWLEFFFCFFFLWHDHYCTFIPLGIDQNSEGVYRSPQGTHYTSKTNGAMTLVLSQKKNISFTKDAALGSWWVAILGTKHVTLWRIKYRVYHFLNLIWVNITPKPTATVMVGTLRWTLIWFSLVYGRGGMHWRHFGRGIYYCTYPWKYLLTKN